MTKKSQARLTRDSRLKDARSEANNQIAGNVIYDDIKDVYINCAKTLIGYSEALDTICQPDLVPHMDDSQKQKIGLLTDAIKSDIDVFVGDLITINKPFVDKKGGETKLENFIDTIGVVDQFSEFIGRCKGTLDPTFASLAAEITVVVDSIKSERKDEELRDPAVISDVESRVVA